MQEMTDELQRELERQIVARLRPYLGRKMNGRMLERAQETVNDIVARFRLSELPMPDLVVVCLPSQSWLQIYRKDLDRVGVENVIRFLWAKFSKNVHTPMQEHELKNELAEAIMRAYPWYRRAGREALLSPEGRPLVIRGGTGGS